MTNRTPEQKSEDLRSSSEDFISLANSLNMPDDDRCALTAATTALALEQRRTADALDRIANAFENTND